MKKQGLARGRYNQIANYALAQSEINIAIGNKPPEIYLSEVAQQCNGGRKKYGALNEIELVHANLRINCIPEVMWNGEAMEYDIFLQERRKLMATKMKAYFQTL